MRFPKIPILSSKSNQAWKFAFQISKFLNNFYWFVSQWKLRFLGVAEPEEDTFEGEESNIEKAIKKRWKAKPKCIFNMNVHG